jgi:UDP-N-acetylmuramate dehydrogenase
MAKCGAEISKKHAGFIINNGNATAADVLKLSKKVKTKIYKLYKIKLEEEPVVIGI